MSWIHLACWCLALLAFAVRARSRSPALAGARRLSPERDGMRQAFASRLDGDGEEPPRALTPAQKAARDEICGPTLQRLLRAWVMRLGVPRADREDLAHDATEAALRSLHTFDPQRGRADRWLNRIAVNVTAKWWDRARHRREELVETPIEGEDSAPLVTERIEAEQDRLEMRSALVHVPPDEREVVIAYDLDGEAMADIAARLGLPASTAYKWRARGIAALAALLRPERG